MEPETPEQYAARIKRGDRIAWSCVRAVLALVPLFGAGVLFPWYDTFGAPPNAYQSLHDTWKPAGKRYDNDTAAGVFANSTDLVRVDLARLESFVLFGIAVFIAAPRRA